MSAGDTLRKHGTHFDREHHPSDGRAKSDSDASCARCREYFTHFPLCFNQQQIAHNVSPELTVTLREAREQASHDIAYTARDVHRWTFFAYGQAGRDDERLWAG